MFVHGLGGQWQNWLENIPRFAQERRVVAIDLPGFGLLGAARASRSRIELYGRVVAELCERLDLAPAVLVGNSMGGFVSAEVAIRSPEIVERLMLVASAGVSQMDWPSGRCWPRARSRACWPPSNVAQMRAHGGAPALRHWVMASSAATPAGSRRTRCSRA